MDNPWRVYVPNFDLTGDAEADSQNLSNFLLGMERDGYPFKGSVTLPNRTYLIGRNDSAPIEV